MTKLRENKVVNEPVEQKNETKSIEKDEPTKPKSIGDYLQEWSGLITELCDKEKQLDIMKESIFNKEQYIIGNTDFDELYGKNNKDVRKAHLDKMMMWQYKAKKKLEYRINYINRSIPYVKSLIRVMSIEMDLKK